MAKPATKAPKGKKKPRNTEARIHIAEKQQKIKDYLSDVARLPLKELLHDPLFVHSLETHCAAYKERDRVLNIRRLLKELAKAKPGNVEPLRLQHTLGQYEKRDDKVPDSSVSAPSTPLFSFIPVSRTVISSRKELISEIRSLLAHTAELPLLSLQHSPCVRNLTASTTSCNNLLKKADKSNNTQKKVLNEIKSASSFRNGVIKQESTVARKAEETVPRNSVIEQNSTVPNIEKPKPVKRPTAPAVAGRTPPQGSASTPESSSKATPRTTPSPGPEHDHGHAGGPSAQARR